MTCSPTVSTVSALISTGCSPAGQVSGKPLFGGVLSSSDQKPSSGAATWRMTSGERMARHAASTSQSSSSFSSTRMLPAYEA